VCVVCRAVFGAYRFFFVFVLVQIRGRFVNKRNHMRMLGLGHALVSEGPYKRRSRLKLSSEVLKFSRRLRHSRQNFRNFSERCHSPLSDGGYILTHLPRIFNRISIRKFGKCKALSRVRYFSISLPSALWAKRVSKFESSFERFSSVL